MEIDPASELEALRKRASCLGVIPRGIWMDGDGGLRMARMDYTPFSGHQAATDYITLNLCTKRVAPIRRRSTRARLDGVLRPGTVTLTLPDGGSDVKWGRCEMMAFGVDDGALAERLGLRIDRAALSPAASTLHRDPLLTSVMTALCHEGEAHGLTTAFFEHGLSLVFSRFSELVGSPPKTSTTRALSPMQVVTVERFIQDRLEIGATVREMADLVGRDPTEFTRALRDATGLAPYQLLTKTRMEHAARMLTDGARVTDAALAVGYVNPSKFADAFRRYTGELPSRTRRRGQ